MKQEINELENNLIDMIYTFCNRSSQSKDHNEITKFVISMTENFPEYWPLKDCVDDVVYKYETRYGIKTYEPGKTLADKKTSKTWLSEVKGQTNHDFQNRYESYLISATGGHLGIQATNYILKEAESVLAYCADPTSNDQKLGLVVGDVQSGKTANYLALASMACDYGYKVILILSGTTESLRRQTQRRVDEGVVGAVSSSITSQAIEYVGVGKVNSEKGQYYAIPLTTDFDDFTKLVPCSPADLNKPMILVVKKNKTVLENVQTWLKPGEDVSSSNILIIDDECDNASINTKTDENPTVINKLIREIFNNFPCATYVGYTATPFANIFINSASNKFMELFPKDFIHRLKTTSEDYFGIKKVFQGDDSFIEILDTEEPYFIASKHDKDLEIPVLPDSLKNAICSFLICCCIRTLRGDKTEHRSMMVNASRFNSVQGRIADAIWNYICVLKATIPQYDRYSIDRFRKNNELNRIYNLFEESSMFEEARKSCSFKDVQNTLYSEIQMFVVRLYNYTIKKEDIFNYNDYEDIGARVIVVGGFSLSRGLTLEGLMISYYNRHAEAYDTLLQMCRWFGYRPNYEDLCKIYMTDANYDCFQTVIRAIEDLDTQFERMCLEGKTPKDFGLMVLESPDILETKLLVTARNKSKHSEEIDCNICFSGEVFDTTKLSINPDTIRSNDQLVADFVKSLIKSGYELIEMNSRHIFKNVSKELIAQFIEKLIIPPENNKFNVSSLSSIISKSDNYVKWDIVFATGKKDEANSKHYILYDHEGGECLNIYPPKRSFVYDNGDGFITFYKNNNRLIDPGILNAGLDDQQLKVVENNKKIREEQTGKVGDAPIAKDFLDIPGRNPLLIIVPMVLNTTKSPNNEEISLVKEKIAAKVEETGSCIIGFGLGFPGKKADRVVYKYRANSRKIEERYIQEEDDDNEE